MDGTYKLNVLIYCIDDIINLRKPFHLKSLMDHVINTLKCFFNMNDGWIYFMNEWKNQWKVGNYKEWDDVMKKYGYHCRFYKDEQACNSDLKILIQDLIPNELKEERKDNHQKLLDGYTRETLEKTSKDYIPQYLKRIVLRYYYKCASL